MPSSISQSEKELPDWDLPMAGAGDEAGVGLQDTRPQTRVDCPFDRVHDPCTSPLPTPQACDPPRDLIVVDWPFDLDRSGYNLGQLG
jgi:hypothetical protein